ncbi:MAG TPA: hypothetical protein VL547_06950 [Dinghuibacter sp.]|uniref:hypothetical protein n=1 Tax=Dinghuibacter sp. TaxID=2024697 RepID=UPI002D0BC515|nr:hypothetical protein [Dinghuibacter sp.]HTJ11743.1 hypothetical protein [Dinghuibacter sp.]
MQERLRTFNIALLCLTLSASAVAGDVTREKDYSKSYPLSSSDNVSISNSFGKVDVHTWDKNEVKVDVHIKVTAEDESDASYMLGQIKVEDDKSGSQVDFHTNTDMNDHEEHHNRKRSFSIDYTVYIPATQPLNLKNSFGPTTMPDYNGPVELTSKFGSLDAGRLTSVKSLHVEFGKCQAKSVNGGYIAIKFSKANIDEVSGNIDADFEFCDVMDLRVASGIKGLKITNKYTHLNLRIASGIPAKFDISTNFGSLNNNSGYKIESSSDEDEGRHHPMFKKNYTGKSGDGSVDVILRDEFATVDIS